MTVDRYVTDGAAMLAVKLRLASPGRRILPGDPLANRRLPARALCIPPVWRAPVERTTTVFDPAECSSVLAGERVSIGDDHRVAVALEPALASASINPGSPCDRPVILHWLLHRLSSVPL